MSTNQLFMFIAVTLFVAHRSIWLAPRPTRVVDTSAVRPAKWRSSSLPAQGRAFIGVQGWHYGDARSCFPAMRARIAGPDSNLVENGIKRRSVRASR